ncbi:FliM/FliN family flagellar motor switch protein [Vibrio aquaticus]|uniref:FliM/FliN family flagellar motor switch protein n=1 Tax=Vibrio aquaticus TaxID=2496559 RepID=UPI001FCA3705|nr:FliM/FliN family flagellar motor switch protein [Vibrio aquaticus]
MDIDVDIDIDIDIVIANCKLSLNELNNLQSGEIKNIENFSQSSVQLKSGNQLVAEGTLLNLDGEFVVAIDGVNEIEQ